MTTRKFETDNTAPVPSEQEAKKRHADYYLKTTSEEDRLQREHAERNASEQEVTPEHSPLPWELQVGEQCCFHSGNRVALTVWHGLDTEEPTNETIAEFWPASNDLDIKDAKFVLEAVNSHAELKARVREIQDALGHVYMVATQLWGMNPDDTCLREARAALNKEEKCKES